MNQTYQQFLDQKSHMGGEYGFEPLYMPDFLFDFQKALLTWQLRKGRGAIFADCGLGKTALELAFAQNVVQKTNGNALILTPLAVASQTVREGEKFGIECSRSMDGKIKSKITVTNYEKMHYFNPLDFQAVICDESSAIKNFEGERQKIVNEFMKKTPYRGLFTATAAPNDYIELGTSAEVLGELGRMDMLSQFFKNDTDSNHPIWWGARWRFKSHGEKAFWRWVVSWARAIKKPSDIGFSDNGFILPELQELEHCVSSLEFDDRMVPLEAETLEEQRRERRSTLTKRCEAAAEKSMLHDVSVSWCSLNPEADLLEKLIPGAKQISGSMSDGKKEELFTAFSSGELKKLVIKPKIGAFGLNWQHCSHMTFFPSHSYEQYYQAVRRCWRFGQKNPVTVDIITSDGERGVFKNLRRKSDAADNMFAQLVVYMNAAIKIDGKTYFEKEMKKPEWL